jgi:hypothetical protein
MRAVGLQWLENDDQAEELTQHTIYKGGDHLTRAGRLRPRLPDLRPLALDFLPRVAIAQRLLGEASNQLVCRVSNHSRVRWFKRTLCESFESVTVRGVVVSGHLGFQLLVPDM